MHLKMAVAIIAALLLVPSDAAAQDATLTGRVTDSSGAAVPGASVTLINISTSGATELVTNEAGLFGFPSTRPGEYELLVTLGGFSPFRVQKLRLEVGQNRDVAVTLQPSRLEEIVNVVASATPLATARAD